MRRLGPRFPREEVAAALERLKREGYVDDSAFAAWWLEQRAAFKPMGARRLWQELHRHGVSPAVISEVLASRTAQAELSAALAVARRKMSSLGRDENRLASFLSRRGFTPPVIEDVLRALKESEGDFY